jgi:hypothetical protein
MPFRVYNYNQRTEWSTNLEGATYPIAMAWSKQQGITLQQMLQQGDSNTQEEGTSNILGYQQR